MQDAETGAATGLENLSAFHDELRQRSSAALWYWQMHWWLSLVHIVALGVMSAYDQRLGLVARGCVLAAPDLIIILGITAWIGVVRNQAPLPYMTCRLPTGGPSACCGSGKAAVVRDARLASTVVGKRLIGWMGCAGFRMGDSSEARRCGEHDGVAP